MASWYEGGVAVHILGLVGVRQGSVCIRERTPAFLPKTKRPELASHRIIATDDVLLIVQRDILFHHQGQALLI